MTAASSILVPKSPRPNAWFCRSTRATSWKEGRLADLHWEGCEPAASPCAATAMKKPGPANHAESGLFGAEHRVRTGDLRLGNEAARHSRSFRSLHESPRSCDFTRVSEHRSRPRFHESSCGFSILMCPACATPPIVESPEVARCDPGFRIAWLLDFARLRPLRALRVATLQGPAERDQVRLPNAGQGGGPGPRALLFLESSLSRGDAGSSFGKRQASTIATCARRRSRSRPSPPPSAIGVRAMRLPSAACRRALMLNSVEAARLMVIGVLDHSHDRRHRSGVSWVQPPRSSFGQRQVDGPAAQGNLRSRFISRT
jgi:hypothetical protein